MEETKDEEVEFVKDFLGMVLLNNVGGLVVGALQSKLRPYLDRRVSN